MDTDLFELCREVYKRTGWGDWSQPDGDSYQAEAYWKHLKGETEADAFISNEHSNWSDSEWLAPLYTSDYLLEKLPNWSTVTKEGMHADIQMEYKYSAQIVDSLPVLYADTPLKALLRLTIALDDAGELK